MTDIIQPHRLTHDEQEEINIMMRKAYRSLDDIPLVIKVEDLMPILDIGRNTAYELVRCGQIHSIRVGRQLRIPRDALIDFICGNGKNVS